MAKYSKFRFDSGTKYGEGDPVASSPFTGSVVWILHIDWTGLGFSGYNEAQWMRGMSSFRGRRNFIKADGSGLEPMGIGTLSVKLDNTNRRFDPYYTSSPIYPNVLPGKRIQLSVLDIANSTQYIVFTGMIKDIDSVSERDVTTITAEDGMGWLADADFLTNTIYTSTIDKAIGIVMDSTDWWGGRNIKPTTQPIQVFEPGEGFGLPVANALAEANLGHFFIDKLGRATFYPVSYNSQTSHSIDEDVVLKPIERPNPWETVRNKIVVTANRRGKQPTSTLWAINRPETFDAAETINFYASFPRADNIAYPISGEDYTANTAANSYGTDVSSGFRVMLYELTTESCRVEVTNNSGDVAYLTTLRITGRKIISSPEIVRNNDSTSISKFGPRRLELDNEWLQDRQFATVYANWLNIFLKTPQVNPVIRIEQRPSVQYAPDLLDKIAFTAASLSIDDTFYVGGINHQWQSESGQSVITTLYLQKVIYNNATITPDPFYPGLPEVPDVPNNDLPPWLDPNTPLTPLTPSLDPTDSCVGTNAPKSGPFLVKPDRAEIQSDGTTEMYIMFPCRVRPNGSSNGTMIYLYGSWQSQSGGIWAEDSVNDWWSIEAIDNDKAAIITGTVFGAGSTRYATFSAGVPTEIAGFRIKLNAGSGGGAGTYYGTEIDSINDGWSAYGGVLSNTGNVLGAPDGQFMSLYIPTASGAGNVWVRFGIHFPNGGTITRHTNTGHQTGNNVGAFNDDDGAIAASTGASVSTGSAVDGAIVFMDPSTGGTEYSDAVSITGYAELHKIRINYAYIENVCG